MSIPETEEIRKENRKLFDADDKSSEEEDTVEEEKKEGTVGEEKKEEKKQWTNEDVWNALNPAPKLSTFEDYAEKYEMDVIGMRDLYSVFQRYGKLSFK